MNKTPDNKIFSGRVLNSAISNKLKNLWIPLRIKITSPYLFLAVIIAISTGYIVSQLIFDTVEERYINQLIEGGKLASESLVNEEDRLLETLRLLAHAERIPDAIIASDATLLRDLAFGIVVDHREDSVEFLDNEGNLILTIRHREGGLVEEYDFSSGGGPVFLEWDFISSVLDQNNDQFGNRYSGIIQADWGNYLYIAGPILGDSNEPIGVVIVGKTLPNLVNKIRQETLTQVTFYNFDGTVLESTFQEPNHLAKEDVNQILSIQDEGSVRRYISPQRSLSVNFIDYDEILAPLEIRNNDDSGILGVALPKTFLVSASNVTRAQVTLFTIGSIAIVFIIGWYISLYISRPITNLMKASTTISEGNFDIQLEPVSNDEISVLTNSFNQMVLNLKVSRQSLIDAYDETLIGWSKALELRDKETEGHTQRVAETTVLIAKSYQMTDDEMINIKRGAILHDIGKMAIPDEIMQKPGELSSDEWEIMKKHPEYAIAMLREIDFLTPALEIPYCHHENWDGSGYPRGLKGEEIPLSARIFSVVDSWDAIRSSRPYHQSVPIEEAIERINSEIGKRYDPDVVSRFLRQLSDIESIRHRLESS